MNDQTFKFHVQLPIGLHKTVDHTKAGPRTMGPRPGAVFGEDAARQQGVRTCQREEVPGLGLGWTR